MRPIDRLRKAVHQKQLIWARLQMSINRFDGFDIGEVSEQSVILKKMDEIANSFPHPSIKGDLLWNPEHTRVTFVRDYNGRYIVGCDPYVEDYAKSHAARYAILDKIPQRYFENYLNDENKV